ncbi:hypothetical protein [Rickettsia endosymbiont of Urophora cardui]|uniref:hypothetical protein n=1 Tax=Rickettsia endosymbiont of Urophora cardui TaxID=3066265 RepID=UPI00313C0FAD
MIAESHIETIKQVGANGQVSLGKKYAGNCSFDKKILLKKVASVSIYHLYYISNNLL